MKKREGRSDNGGLRRGLVESELLEHATRLFAEWGFAGTTLQDIADAMGLSRPSLYHYVKSKDELLARLVEEITTDAARQAKAIASRKDLDAVGKLGALERPALTEQALRGLLISGARAAGQDGITGAFARLRQDVEELERIVTRERGDTK